MTRIRNEMGEAKQILLCHSWDTEQLLTAYWKQATKNRPQDQSHQYYDDRALLLLKSATPEGDTQPQLNDYTLEANTRRTSISTSFNLRESVKCVLNLMDTNQAGPDAPKKSDDPTTYDTLNHDEDDNGHYTPNPNGRGRPLSFEEDYALPTNEFAYQSSHRKRSTNHNLANDLLSSTFREHSYTLCRLKEALNNYYWENCVYGQEIGTPSPVGLLLNVSSPAFTDTISTTELGGLFGNDSIMNDSLTQLGAHAEIAAVESEHLTYHWNFLFFVIIFIIAGGLGNILVCLAIALDRKLQNVTNYFLLSLAIADLLVSLFVMPLGAIPTFLGGHWPLGEHWCNVYVTCDVLACSASIWHMCFISLGRYLGIKNPLGSRHRSTKRIVGIKIAVAWLMAMPVSSSIAILGSVDMQNIIPEPNVCTINNKQFFVYGSLVAFYIPMVIMVSTYALTVQLLRKKARFAAAHPESEIFRSLMSHRLGGAPRYTKHSTSGGDGVDHNEVTNFKQQQRAQQPPPYFRGKVKSISKTESYGQSKNDMNPGHRALTHSNDQASALMTWNQSQLNSSSLEESMPPLSRIPNNEEPVNNQHQQRSNHTDTTHSKINDNDSAMAHKQRGCGNSGGNGGALCNSISSSISSHGRSNNTGRKKSIFRSTCDQATQTSPKPLKRAADMRGHKLKLNIQSVASPYLNFNLRLPKTRKRASLSANAVANEQKATKVLGIVFFTFVFCWAPFFVLNIVLVIYPRDNIPDHVIDVCLWLGYVSSTINPIIYTIFNRTFRAAFIRLLRCNCQRSGRPYRYRSVTETKGAASLCARSALPLAISLQGTGFFNTSSTVSNTRHTSTTVTDSEC